MRAIDGIYLTEKSTGRKEWVTLAVREKHLGDTIKDFIDLVSAFGATPTEPLLWETENVIISLEGKMDAQCGAFEREYWDKYMRPKKERVVTIELEFDLGVLGDEKDYVSMSDRELKESIQEEIEEKGLSGWLEEYYDPPHEVSVKWPVL